MRRASAAKSLEHETMTGIISRQNKELDRRLSAHNHCVAQVTNLRNSLTQAISKIVPCLIDGSNCDPDYISIDALGMIVCYDCNEAWVLTGPAPTKAISIDFLCDDCGGNAYYWQNVNEIVCSDCEQVYEYGPFVIAT